MISSKDLTITSLRNKYEVKEIQVGQLKSQIENLNKTMKEPSSSHKMNIQMNEDRYSKKCKELEVILKDKKCRNCPICLEGMNLQFKDQIDLITDLNKKIFEQV